MRLSLTAAFFASVILSPPVEAKSITDADCESIKAGFANFARFHKSIMEIRLEMAREAVGLVIDEGLEASAKREVLETIGERIDGVALDVKEDLLPAITAFRRVCSG